MVAQTLGFQITGLLALGGVGGIAVGFAAKDILANFFGGLAIYLDRPFVVGEWIRSPDKELEGTVEYISWRHTRIRGFNKNPIYVPNSVFATILVENPSRMSHRRIKETIGLRYDDFGVVAAVVADIRAMMQEHPDIDATQTLIVNFNQFGASSLDLMIYAFTRTTVWVDYHAVKQDVLLKIGQIIAGHGAEIAFPTQTLHLQEAQAPATPASAQASRFDRVVAAGGLQSIEAQCGGWRCQRTAQRVAHPQPAALQHAGGHAAVAAHHVQPAAAEQGFHARTRVAGPGDLQHHLVADVQLQRLIGEGRARRQQVEARYQQVAPQAGGVDGGAAAPRRQQRQVFGSASASPGVCRRRAGCRRLAALRSPSRPRSARACAAATLTAAWPRAGRSTMASRRPLRPNCASRRRSSLNRPPSRRRPGTPGRRNRRRRRWPGRRRTAHPRRPRPAGPAAPRAAGGPGTPGWPAPRPEK